MRFRIFILLISIISLLSSCKSEKLGKGFLPGTDWDMEEYFIYFTSLDSLNQTEDLSTIKGVIANEISGGWSFSEDDKATITIDYHFDALPYGSRGIYSVSGDFKQEKRQSSFEVIEGSETHEYHIHQRESRKEIWVKWESSSSGSPWVHMVHLKR
ncbi:MAG: hypothetical protein R2813_11165 [Flavobacteriales bacterium]